MRNFRTQPRRKRGHPQGSRNPTRDAELIRLFTETSVTLQELGDAYGITRERVRQVLKRQGITANDGARRAYLDGKQEARAELQEAKREERPLHVYGCTRSEALALNGGRPLSELGTLATHYSYRRDNVGRTDGWDQWQITLPEWAALWAGKWLGNRHGPNSWVVHRLDKTKPWSVDNVQLMSRRDCTSIVIRGYYANLRSESCSSR